ncbi:MAG: LptF/LptG family permease [Spirochaetales bacterium]|nr:LptF/LptG family permease [Spirochaetales bacterium]
MNGKHRYTTLYVYISKEYIFTFFVSFFFFFSIFFINQLLVVAKNVLIANVNIIDVFRIILYSIPVILSFTFPFASLTGAAMTIGQLASQNELLALRASGISFKRIFTPVIIISILFSFCSFMLNDIFQPLGTIKYKELYRELLYRNPNLELNSHSVTQFGNTFFITGDVKNNEVNNLMILEQSSLGLSVISSKAASFSEAEKSSDLITIKLDSVEGFSPRSKAVGDYDYFISEHMEYNILLNVVSFNFMGVTPNDMSIRDLLSEIKKLKINQTATELQSYKRITEYKYLTYLNYYQDFSERRDYEPSNTYNSWLNYLASINSDLRNKKLQYYQIELYKKTALPVACAALVFFAFPLSAFRLKNGRLVGFGVGIIAATFYWFMLFAGQSLGTRTFYSPILLMWLPNLIYIGIGLFLFSIRSKR